MRGFLIAALIATGAVVPASEGACAAACCKVCRKGKACGDSCIAADRNCKQPKGCACDA